MLEPGIHPSPQSLCWMNANGGALALEIRPATALTLVAVRAAGKCLALVALANEECVFMSATLTARPPAMMAADRGEERLRLCSAAPLPNVIPIPGCCRPNLVPIPSFRLVV